MRVLWTHNFDPNVVSSGVFMHLLLQKIRSLGVDVELFYTGQLRGIVDVLRAARRIRNHGRNFDIVHSQYGSACGWASSFATGPKLITLRGTDLLGVESGSIERRVRSSAGRMLTFRSLDSYETIIVVSNHMRNCVEARHQGLTIETIPSGLDLDTFNPVDQGEARKKLGEANNTRPWILAASVLSSNPIKRWPLAKSAFESLQQRIPNVQLKTISGVAHDEMPLWINASDVVLVTSTHEGWPNIVKEGLACNVPFVSTNVSDLHMIADIEPSCQIAPADPIALADAITRTLEAGRTANLRQHVESMDLEVVARKYLSLYEKLASTPRKLAA